MTFPLRLSAFERYMVVDDRDEYPTVFHIRLSFEGPIDEDAFREAVAEGVARHPLLQARVSGDDDYRLDWVATPDPAVHVSLGPLDQPMEFPDGRERIDLRQENGLRVWVRSGRDPAGEARTTMNFQFHHVCCDGIGAYRVIEDILALYDRKRRGPESGELRPLDAGALAKRTAFGLPWWRRWLRIPQELWGVTVGIAIFFINRPVDLPTSQRPQLSPEEEARVLDMPAHTFTPAESKTLKRVAAEAGATLNDLLLRDTLLGMKDWIERVDDSLRKRYLRIMVPINLRGPHDDQMPAANVVGMVFVDRRMHKYPRQRLLWGLKWETRWFKFFRFGMAFPRSCQVLPYVIPGGLTVLARTDRCYATSALSNMGRVFYGHRLRTADGRIAAGDLVLTGVESAPPVRTHSSTSFTALSYNGRLTLVMNYDRRHFTAEAARELLDVILDRFRETIELANNAPEELPQEEAVLA